MVHTSFETQKKEHISCASLILVRQFGTLSVPDLEPLQIAGEIAFVYMGMSRTSSLPATPDSTKRPVVYTPANRFPRMGVSHPCVARYMVGRGDLRHSSLFFFFEYHNKPPTVLVSQQPSSQRTSRAGRERSLLSGTTNHAKSK